MPTELQLADGRVLLVDESFDAVLGSVQSQARFIEFTVTEVDDDVPRHGYADMEKASTRVALNPAHIVSVIPAS